MTAANKETTANIRVTAEEKAAWKETAPNGRISAWLRSLANREVTRQRRKR